MWSFFMPEKGFKNQLHFHPFCPFQYYHIFKKNLSLQKLRIYVFDIDGQENSTEKCEENNKKKNSLVKLSANLHHKLKEKIHLTHLLIAIFGKLSPPPFPSNSSCASPSWSKERPHLRIGHGCGTFWLYKTVSVRRHFLFSF